jgi:hypothetical protein
MLNFLEKQKTILLLKGKPQIQQTKSVIEDSTVTSTN